MSRYLLDTNAYSSFLRGVSIVIDRLDRSEWVGISPIVVSELRAGFQRKALPRKW